VSTSDEKDLVERCRKGDDDAWRELVDRFGPRVYAIAYHFTMKREEAEELSQEIFLKLFENLHRYDGGFPLVAWILSVSRNLCIDRYRRRKREKSFRFVTDEAVTALLKSDDDPATAALRKERTQLLFSALSEIPEDLAEILILRDLNGLAYEEIGKAAFKAADLDPMLPEAHAAIGVVRSRNRDWQSAHESFQRRTHRPEIARTIPLDVVSREVIKAIEHNRFLTYVPRHYAAFVWCMAACPVLFRPLLHRLLTSRVNAVYDQVSRSEARDTK